MPVVEKHPPGNFCWFEVGTTDAKIAKSFYSQLFGWETEDMPTGPGATYTLLKKRGKSVAGLYELPPKLRARGVPPHWLSYVAVESADTTTRRATSLGGRVLMDSIDVMEVGRMAVLSDPTGATFAVWQPKLHPGVGLVGEPGSICWTELATRDAAGAAKFYRGLFDWAEQTADLGGTSYTMCMNAGQPAAGMMQMAAERGDIAPHWIPYFAVEDCEASVDAAKKLGGRLEVPPTDVPNVGRFAVLEDPTGAVFSVIKLQSSA